MKYGELLLALNNLLAEPTAEALPAAQLAGEWLREGLLRSEPEFVARGVYWLRSPRPIVQGESEREWFETLVELAETVAQLLPGAEGGAA